MSGLKLKIRWPAGTCPDCHQQGKKVDGHYFCPRCKSTWPVGYVPPEPQPLPAITIVGEDCGACGEVSSEKHYRIAWGGPFARFPGAELILCSSCHSNWMSWITNEKDSWDRARAIRCPDDRVRDPIFCVFKQDKLCRRVAGGYTCDAAHTMGHTKTPLCSATALGGNLCVSCGHEILYGEAYFFAWRDGVISCFCKKCVTDGVMV